MTTESGREPRDGMQAKGSFFVGRKTFIVQRFGEARWNQFVEKLARLDPTFKSPVLATSLLPVSTYAFFQEQCAREFFGGDENSYWEMGEAAAVWALTDGPYAALAKDKNYKILMDKLPLVWTMYFTVGRLDAKAFDDHAEFKITGNGLPHVCVEYAVMGFGRKAIEMVGKKTKTTKRLKGVKDGDGSVVHYEFWFV